MPNYLPLVSIVLPVFNGERTLRTTLESLLAQTYSHFELLIGIDGTKDGSKAIAEAFGDERIKIYEQPTNLGLANNLNSLIKVSSASSKYIAMAEQDDVYVPQRLQWQLEVMQKQPEVGLVSGIANFVSDTSSVLFPGLLVQKKQFSHGIDLFKYLYVNQLKVVNTCMLFRKETHVNHHLEFKSTYGNFNVDWDYVLRFCLHAKVHGLPKVLVKMNRTSQNISVTTNKWGQFKASRQLIKDFRDEFPNLITEQDYNKALKMCRKIELGHHPKAKLVLYGLYYFLRYGDMYFLRYIGRRIKTYWNK